MFTIIGILFIGWLGAVFVNYLADVLPMDRRFTTPKCINCGEKQQPVNYFLWPRRCTACGRRRGLRTWVVEIVLMAVSLWLWESGAGNLGYLWGWVLWTYFAVVTVIDLEHRLILHPISWFGAVLGFGLGVWQHGLLNTIIGGAAGYSMMFALYKLGELFARWMARRRGEIIDEVALGFGDVNLLGIIGLMLGWPGILAGLLLGILLGGLVSFLYLVGMLLARRYQAFTAIPYAPFLIAAALWLLFLKDILPAWR